MQGTGEHPGNVRKATGTDGSEQVERLVEMNPARHYYRYVMEQTAMPATDYSAELRVRPAGDGESVVEWTADFEVAQSPDPQAMDMVQGFFHAGLDSVKQQYS